MALDLKVQQVVKEPDGVYSVYAIIIDDTTGKTIGKQCVQGSTLKEIKDALRPYWQTIKTNHEEQQSMMVIAQQALDELEAE